MPKNVIVFADGTGQAGGVRAEQRLSNIYKLYRASRVDPDNDIDPAEQVAFYDAGLGTDDDVKGLTSIVRYGKKLLGLVTGRGMTTNIIDCYQFIINHYEPGDRIFLFGFSRGAYTVRCVSNVLSLCGVPTHDLHGAPLPLFRSRIREIASEAVREVYEHGQSHDRAKFEAERDEQGRRFREKYGSGDGDIPNVGTYFIGVFDAVAALGAKGGRRAAIVVGLLLAFLAGIALLAWFADALPYVGFLGAFGVLTVLFGAVTLWKIYKSRVREIRDYPNKGDVKRHTVAWRGDKYDGSLSRRVMYARHAISIDERRADFARVNWGNPKVVRQKGEGETIEPFVQLWFAGNHSDIGGSYPETESRLSDICLQWTIEQATDIPHPLRLDRRWLHLYPSADGLEHCEVTSMQDAINAFVPGWLKWLIRPKGYEVQVRELKPNYLVHPSVDQRFALVDVKQCSGSGAYRPEALRGHDKFKWGYAEHAPEL